MSGYRFGMRCVLGLLVLLLFNTDVSQAAPRARILNENGEFVATVPTMWLDRQHLAIPATAYRHFGLGVDYDNKERRLYISIPETCTVVGLRVGSRRDYHPDLGYSPNISSFPLAQKRNGHFYVSVRFIEEGFEYFSVLWDEKKQELMLRSRD